MKRSVGTPALLFAAVGGIVGSGWLFGPYFAARFAGPSAILAWALGGGLMMLIALTFAELGSSFPITGGVGPLFAVKSWSIGGLYDGVGVGGMDFLHCCLTD